MTPIAPHISAFLEDFLPNQRGSSPHTVDAYAYGFRLLFLFAANSRKLRPCDLNLEDLDCQLITEFLEDLETNRGCKAVSRNARLGAIKSFFRFLEFRVPSALSQIAQILAIPFKKTESKLIAYLNKQEVEALLQAPNLQTRLGLRDYAMIQLMLTTGLRVSELLNLGLSNVTFQPSATIRIQGKGRKERILPLGNTSLKTLRQWLAVRGNPPAPELFVNAQGEPMSRWGFAYILKKHVQQAAVLCPSLKHKSISPHVLRHTCAMVVLDATHDIRKVSLWLGHSSTQTTEIYVRADPSEKQDTIEAITPLNLRKGRFKPQDKLLATIMAHTLCSANSTNFRTITRSQRSRSP